MNKFLVLIAIVLLFTAVPVFAFHNGSQLVCGNCHTMHYSEGGQIPSKANGYFQDADAGGPFEKLLLKANISDLCLECHKDGAYAGAPSVYNTSAGSGIQLPGGDFGYNAKGIAGNAMTAPVGRGHNPYGNAAHPSANFDADVLNGGASGIIPPGNLGAAVTAGEFTCVECHGVHGPLSGGGRSYPYRMLMRTVNGYNTSNDSVLSVAWVADTTVQPTAFNIGPDGANTTLDESTTNHNVYKGGFANWCSSCHPNFHGADESDTDVGDGTDFVRHPTNIDISSLSASKPYSAGKQYDINYPLIKVGGTWTNTAGGTLASSDKVQCLTCHKAHATANPDSLRWDPTQASALTQCNKCHAFGGGI